MREFTTTESLKRFLVGQYPTEELWRVGAVVLAAAALMGVSWSVWGGVMRTFAGIMAAAGLIVAATPIEPALLTDVEAAVSLVARRHDVNAKLVF
ncbi:MAG: hypothetical protein IH801_05745 [Nitrospinae bacterium]|nr:hypothetical protein [Nitrospinota bacterium]